jgi:hypothetical protein
MITIEICWFTAGSPKISSPVRREAAWMRFGSCCVQACRERPFAGWSRSGRFHRANAFPSAHAIHKKVVSTKVLCIFLYLCNKKLKPRSTMS